MEDFKEGLCLAHVSKVLDIFGGKWSFHILTQLFSGTKRYNELQRQLNNVSSKALSDTLKHLLNNGIISRQVYPTTPVTVEYSLTQKGIDFRNVMTEMNTWGKKWLDDPHPEIVSPPEAEQQ
ncbi:helix-turn-helix transcriptional regulator [Paenibacillus oenotherae]|uniref:Helix-turn-helix transcriptional regulator n=1 Tax=Paenibacillus oenotherae TaxID=1435645 RepID=A0ABS7DCK8_9BACL|nr:helix-turn-helix domain-containing protein [Paenibacillus oenotherae]MBW7477237.1 helix-turn-helix transcriptional regulator [Paenibacillus oenotherae]